MTSGAEITGRPMQTPRETVLLRIFFGEADRHCHQPLYEAIVLKAREMHLATVIRGQRLWAFESPACRQHHAAVLRSSGHCRHRRYRAEDHGLSPDAQWYDEQRLVTLEKVQCLQYGRL